MDSNYIDELAEMTQMSIFAGYIVFNKNSSSVLEIASTSKNIGIVRLNNSLNFTPISGLIFSLL